MLTVVHPVKHCKAVLAMYAVITYCTCSIVETAGGLEVVLATFIVIACSTCRVVADSAHLFFICGCPSLKAGLDGCLEQLLQLLKACNGALPLLHREVQPHTPLTPPCIEVMAKGIEDLYAVTAMTVTCAGTSAGCVCV